MGLFSFISPKQSDARQESKVLLERVGEHRIQRITQAVEKVPWSLSLLQLAWTAGPVTFLGAIGGYYLGFGKTLATENLIFFVAYTVITGIIGIVAKVFYNATQGRDREMGEEALHEVIDRLPDLILASRDLYLQSLEPEARKREAATILLREMDVSPSSLETIVLELIDNPTVARAIGRIEIYRRSGLQSRMQDLIEYYRPETEQALAELAEKAPEAASLLRDRFHGKAPNLDMGIPRDDNFIERVLSAIEQDNDLLMTLRDVEEMLILAFELINGRRIPMLTFGYRGRWALGQALDQLNHAHGDYRIAQAVGLSRLKALNAYLAERSGTKVEDLAPGLSAHRLLERALEAINDLSDRLMQLTRRVNHGDYSARSQLKETYETLFNALQLYKEAKRAYNRVGRLHAQLLKASERWEKLVSQQKESHLRLRTGRGRRGLRIYEKVIALNDKEKVEVCLELAEHLRGENIKSKERTIVVSRSGHETPFTVDAAKRLAVEVALALEPHIHLSRPDRQRAINSTSASYLGGLEPGMSAAAKAGWGTAMVREVEENLSTAAEQLALTLVKHYHLDLHDDAIELLHNSYGASRNRLQMLANYSRSSQSAPVSYLSHRPPAVPAPERSWYRSLYKSKQAGTGSFESRVAVSLGGVREH